MLVKLIGPGLKLGNQWHFEGETVSVTKIEYKKNKEYLEIIKEDIEVKAVKKEKKAEIENNKNDKEKLEEKNIEKEELYKLREQAKELGVKATHLMGKDKLIEKIEEATAPKFGEEKNENNEIEEEKIETENSEE